MTGLCIMFMEQRPLRLERMDDAAMAISINLALLSNLLASLERLFPLWSSARHTMNSLLLIRGLFQSHDVEMSL